MCDLIVSEVFDFRPQIVACGRQLASVIEQTTRLQGVDRFGPLLAAPAAQASPVLGVEPDSRRDMSDQRLDAAEPMCDQGGDMAVAPILAQQRDPRAAAWAYGASGQSSSA